MPGNVRSDKKGVEYFLCPQSYILKISYKLNDLYAEKVLLLKPTGMDTVPLFQWIMA